MATEYPYQFVNFVEFSSTTEFSTSRGKSTSSDGAGFTITEKEGYFYVLSPGWKHLGWVKVLDVVNHGWVAIERVAPATLFAAVAAPVLTCAVPIPAWSLHDLSHPVFANALKDCVPQFTKPVVCVVGVPKPRFMLQIAKSGRCKEVVVMGSDYTKKMCGPDSSFAAEAFNLGLKYSFIDTPVSQFTLRWFEVRGKQLRDEVDFLITSLTSYTDQIAKQIRRFGLDQAGGKYIAATGPAFGATVLPKCPDFIMSLSTEFMKYAEQSFCTPAPKSCTVWVDYDTVAFRRKPVVVEKTVTVTEKIKEFKHWTLSPLTGLKASSCEVYDFLNPAHENSDRAAWASYAPTLNGRKQSRHPWARALTVDGPYWFDDVYAAHLQASRHITSKSDISVHVGVFEGVSVHGWHEIDPRHSKMQLCFDIGPYLTGNWGIPRLWNLRDNLKDSMHPIFGASQVTVPLVSNAMHRLGAFAAFVAIDGSHHSSDVLLDAENCWRLLDLGGVMYFDDVASIDGVPIGTDDRCNAARGFATFKMFHAGEYEDIVVPQPCRGAFIKKTLMISDRRGAIGKLFDEGAAWADDNANGRQFAPNAIGRDGSVNIDGEWYYDCHDTQASIALAGALALPKAATKLTAGAFDISGNTMLNFGNAWNIIGTAVGDGQNDNAVAGFGQALKSVGRGFEIGGQVSLSAAKAVAGFWVPKQYLQ